MFSAELSKALRTKIKELCSVPTGILTYLQNSGKYDENTRQANNTFLMSKKKVIQLEMKQILVRVIR